MPGMRGGEVKIRRGRRTDFPALMALLAVGSSGEASKGQMRHWRRLACDPGLDFYVAEQQGKIHGIVLVCYIRDLRYPGWQAILNVVVPAAEEYGIVQALLAFAKARARKRGCQRLLVYEIESRDNGKEVSLDSAGFRPVGEVLSCEV
jgi:N-acetylglutamate synthase-like GNAT family acetyltransferase